MSPPLDAFFLLLMVVSAVAALAARDLLAAVTIFGAFSFFSAMFFASLGALDVAFTEAAVGAAITTVLFVSVLARAERNARRPARPASRARAAAVAVVFTLAGGALLRATGALPPVGDPHAPAARHVSPRYVESAIAETGASNMVTAVLADYRSHDTLGETVVIFAAGLAVLLVLGEVHRARPKAGPVPVALGSPVLVTAVRLLAPFILLFAAYVVAHGHSSPGGGFQGGIILAAALILARLVHAHGEGWGLGRSASLALAASGLLLFAGIGFAGLAFGGTFLDYGALPLGLAPAAARAAGSLGIEVGVGMAVTGVMVLLFDTLMAWETE